jgi:hypothetical protein
VRLGDIINFYALQRDDVAAMRGEVVGFTDLTPKVRTVTGVYLLRKSALYGWVLYQPVVGR